MPVTDPEHIISDRSYLTIRLGPVELHCRKPAARSGRGPIFVAHGRDHVRREEVRRFLERATGRKTIVLEDQPGAGRDILGKLLHHVSGAGFAVVLLTADDEGRVRGDRTWQLRARQNAVMELGALIVSLGRANVVVLHERGVEVPSNCAGVGLVELDPDGDWMPKLAGELRAAGVDVDPSEDHR